MSDGLGSNGVTPQSVGTRAAPPATEAVTTHIAGDAAQRARRRLLLWGIPLFWSALYVYNAYLSAYARALGASLSLVGIIVAAGGFTQLVLRIPSGIAWAGASRSCSRGRSPAR